MANEKIVTLPILQYYDEKLKAWVGTEIDEAVAGLGTVFTLKGSKTDVASLPAEGNETGDIYIVGTAAPFDEYYWDGTQWELMGTTATDISGCVTKEALYEGADGTGTVANPADGTIIKTIYDKIATAQAAADKAQEEVDALETLVGTIPEGATATTVVDYAKELVDAIEEYDDTEVRGLISDNADAIAEVKATADGAVQDVTAGTTNGTIAVDGTDVAVTGLGGAAYKAEDYYELAGAASNAQTAAQNYADGLNTSMNERVEALETATSNQTTTDDIDALFAGAGV